MKSNVKLRIAAFVAGISFLLSGAVLVAPSASAASPAATAFSKCMDGYLTAQAYAYKTQQNKAGLAILYTGYTNCYYALSQRSDISDQTEINAINNYNKYHAMAVQAITAAVLIAYKVILKRYSLKGLGL